MTERTKFTAFITKYALTKGIQEIEVEDRFDISPTMVADTSTRWHTYYHNGEWHRTREEAIERSEALRSKKIASLRKQVSKLEKMKFGEEK